MFECELNKDRINQSMNYIDLFAGAGGLTEGFVRSGFTSVAHLEMDEHACDTLKTRIAYHYLKANKQLEELQTYAA